ncbi:MAG TPA: CoA ester lyase [Pseudonocardia sp.]|nr:CoA ester lyase [Pseudonocardia sp.]
MTGSSADSVTGPDGVTGSSRHGVTGFSPRSVLFVPGHRPDMLAKVARSRPDAVIVDLEDAVAPAAKEQARDTATSALAAERPGVDRVLLRINGVGTPWYDADVAAAATAIGAGHLDGVVLPKYEHPGELTALRAALPAGALVIVGLESALGVADARTLLAERPDAAYFGAEDYIADLGGRRTREGTEVLYARSQVCLAARLAGVPALDQVVVAVHDAEAFRADAEQARALGFPGKICLHPIQVGIAHEVFTPSEAEIEHARAVLAAAEAGVGLVAGQMVDAVHVTMAKAVLTRRPT